MSDDADIGRKRKLDHTTDSEGKRRKLEAKEKKRALKEQKRLQALNGASPSNGAETPATPSTQKSVQSTKADNARTNHTNGPAPSTPVVSASPDQPTSSSKRSTKKKNKHRNATGNLEAAEGAQENAVALRSEDMHAVHAAAQDSPVSTSKSPKAERKKRKAEALTRGLAQQTPAAALKKASRSAWTLHHPVGGKFLDQRPLMTADEQYLICATELAIHVYSVSDSLLYRKLALSQDDADPITCYALSNADSHLVYGAYASGRIAAWSIQTGATLLQWSGNAFIRQLCPAKTQSSVDREAIFYTCEGNGTWLIKVTTFEGDEPTTHDVLQHGEPLQQIQAFEGGLFVAATVGSLIVGKAALSSSGKAKIELREIKVVDAPTCFSARYHQRDGKSVLSVALGTLTGNIFFYQDLFDSLGLGKTSKATANVSASQQFHWHREAVGDVAFSKDGNYLISGGQETVLILWNLDTNKRQYLPHLGSPIRSVVVSPSGASYIVRLNDNSVMVLSTAELKPTANVASLQTPSIFSVPHYQPDLPTVELWRQLTDVNRAPLHVCAAISPKRASELIAAVPTSSKETTITQLNPAMPFIQTYDISTSRQVSRQAATRSSETALNVGPEGNKIVDPTVTQLQVTANGRWLATVDEWAPHPNDLEDISADATDRDRAIEAQRTSQLRIWQYNDEQRMWALNSRIDAPHETSSTTAPGRVLHLIVSPSNSCFATVGGDSMVRIWEPKTVYNNGKIVRGEPDKPNGKTSWILRREVPLEHGMAQDPFQKVSPTRARLAFSNDGSILVATQHFAEIQESRARTCVHFIDPEDGKIHASRGDMFDYPDGIYELGFLDSSLIMVGFDHAEIWDVSSMEKRATINFPSEGLDEMLMGPPPPLLAIDTSTSTFAIAASVPSHAPYADNELRLFTTKLQICRVGPEGYDETIFYETLPRLALALLPSGHATGDAADDDVSALSQGYVVIDAGAAIRTVRPGGLTENNETMNLDIDEPAADADIAETISGQVEDVSMDMEIQADVNRFEEEEEETADRPVVRREQLAQVFDHPSHAMPSITNLFAEVLRLYAPKAQIAQA